MRIYVNLTRSWAVFNVVVATVFKFLLSFLLTLGFPKHSFSGSVTVLSAVMYYYYLAALLV